MAGQTTSQSTEKGTSPNWFICWSDSDVTKYIIPLISCAQRYSDDGIDTIIYRYGGNRMDTVIFQGFRVVSILFRIFGTMMREIWVNYELCFDTGILDPGWLFYNFLVQIPQHCNSGWFWRVKTKIAAAFCGKKWNSAGFLYWKLVWLYRTEWCWLFYRYSSRLSRRLEEQATRV